MQLWKRKSGVVYRCPYIIVNGDESVLYVHDNCVNVTDEELEGDVSEHFSLVFETDQKGYAKLLITLLDEVTKHVTV